jgi:hypothetical protein
MKKTLLLFLLLLFHSLVRGQITIPQLQQGVPMEYLIQNIYFTNTGSCPVEAYSIYAYPIPITTGVEWRLVVDSVAGSVTYSPPPSTPLNEGDTLLFTTANGNTFGFSLPTGSRTYMRLIVSGTPSVASQSYPCYIKVEYTTSSCFSAIIFSPDTAFANCTVSPSSVPELPGASSYYIYADHYTHSVKVIASKNAGAEFHLFDVAGRKVLERPISQYETAIDMNGKEGIYIWQLSTAERNMYGKIFIR